MMKLVVRTAILVLVAGLVLAPAAALAGRSSVQWSGHGGSGRGIPGASSGQFAASRGAMNGFGHGGGRGFHGGAQGFGHPRFAPHGFHHHHFNHFARPFGFGFGVSPFFAFAPPVVTYAAPLSYYSPSIYDDPPVAYAPPAYTPPPVYSPPPAYTPVTSGIVSVGPVSPPPPPTPNVVEYPTGRYELRGDGMTVAYTWVWIPNPPPAPPVGPPPPRVPSGGDEPAPRRSQLYHWVDDEGVTHFTDRPEIVPEKYRTPSKRFPSS